jgi:hypothetical protein
MFKKIKFYVDGLTLMEKIWLSLMVSILAIMLVAFSFSINFIDEENLPLQKTFTYENEEKCEWEEYLIEDGKQIIRIK